MVHESRFSEVSPDIDQTGFPSPDINSRVSSPAPQYQARENGTSTSGRSEPLGIVQETTKLPTPEEEKIAMSATHNFESYPEVVPSGRNSNDAMEHFVPPPPPPNSQKMLHEQQYRNNSDQSPDYHKEGVAEGQTAASQRRRKICGVPLLLFWIIIAVVVLAIALGVGLGVGLTQGKKSSSSSSDNSGLTGAEAIDFAGGAINPKYYSQAGAFNGSGVAIASVNFGIDDSLFMFYQQDTGEIQQMIVQASGDWSFVTTVATNARNATPLSAVAYIVNAVATWHLFYINEDNIVQQRTSSNASNFQTNIWADGPINSLNLQAYGSQGELVGMQACYWGDFYGSQTVFNDGFNVSSTAPKTGMNLWYPSDNSSFTQYAWTTGDVQWNKSDTWSNMNVNAGVACQSWESGTTSYVMMIDQSNTLNIFWKDIDLNKTSTSSHPIDKWTNTSIAVNNVYAATSLGYTDYVTYQAPDLTLHGVNISWAAENTSFVKAPDAALGVVSAAAEDPTLPGIDAFALASANAAVPGSHFGITGLQDNLGSGGKSLALFYQAVGNDVTLATRPLLAGSWSFSTVPVVGAANVTKSATQGF